MSSTGGLSSTRRLGVACLSLLLATIALGATWLGASRWDGAVLPFHVAWWALAPAYLVTYKLRLEYEYRREGRSFYLTHLPLAIGIVFVAPWWHLLARTSAVALNGLRERQRPAKFTFNVALGAFETATATYVLSLLAGRPAGDRALWLAIMAALVASELLSVLILELLLALVGARQNRARRLASFVSALVTALVFGGLSIVFIAAAWTDPLTLVLVTFVALALVLAYARHRTLAAQHQQTSELQQFVKGLGPLDLDTPEGSRVLGHVRELLFAHVLELAVQRGDTWCRYTVAEGQPLSIDLPLADEVLHGTEALAAACIEAGDKMVTPLVGSSGLLGLLTVRERFGDQHTFGLHDLRLLETIASELSAVLERGRLQRDLTLAATTDSLTRLPNLNEATTRLDRLLATSTSGVLAATVSVDSFREVNDTLGHQVGDDLLREVTRRLELTFPDALLGRIGGGRFLVAVPRDSFASDVAMFGLGLRAQIEGGAQLGPVGTHIKVSVGCVHGPEHGDDAPTLIRRAETAMYSARHASGGPVVWEPVYEVEGHRRLAVVMALREAVATGAIGVAYQPKVRTTDTSIAGVEALARWTHPALGAISPAEFIPLAEAAGLMGPLTTLVLRQALTACKGWQGRGGRIGVSVNVSAETLLDPMFVTEVAALLTAVNVSSDLLTLELTEGVVVGDPALAAERMHELRRLGVKLSVDDFGTGYSSLTYLKGLPIDEVKVDKGFIDDVTDSSADQAVVRAVVDIAHTLGLAVVAEGIETAEQLVMLTALGVDEGQGYLLARPMAAMDMAQWLRRREAAATVRANTSPNASLPSPTPST